MHLKPPCLELFSRASTLSRRILHHRDFVLIAEDPVMHCRMLRRLCGIRLVSLTSISPPGIGDDWPLWVSGPFDS